jgi:hypothetical protein
MQFYPDLCCEDRIPLLHLQRKSLILSLNLSNTNIGHRPMRIHMNWNMPSAVQQRASQESQSHKRTVMKGWETRRENSPAKR